MVWRIQNVKSFSNMEEYFYISGAFILKNFGSYFHHFKTMSISHKSVFFIGGGNMASAIIAGLDRDYWRVIVAEVSDEQREKVKQLYNVETTDKPDEKIAVCTMWENFLKDK